MSESESVEPKGGGAAAAAEPEATEKKATESDSQGAGAPSSPPAGAASGGAGADSAADGDAPESGEAASTTASEPPADPLDAAKAEAKKYREQLLRTAADFDNFRKRARRDQEDALRRGKESVIKDLLPVFDNMERAIAHVQASDDVQNKGVLDGLNMVMKQFLSTLDRMGVTRVQTVGVPFDPTLHEAIQHVESAEHPAGTVAAEVQSGYRVGEHLIRAAMVVVSKGAPEGAAPAEEAEAKDDSDSDADGEA